MFPTSLLFGLRWPSTGAYKLMVLVAISGRADSNEYFPELILPVSSSLDWATATPNSAEDLSILPSRSCLVSYGFTIFLSLGPSVHKTLCVPSKTGVCFPQSCNQALLAFKAILWRLLLLISEPQTGQPDVGFRPLIPIGKPWQNNDFPVCALPTGWEWGLTVLQMCPFYHFLVASSLSLKVDDLFW